MLVRLDMKKATTSERQDRVLLKRPFKRGIWFALILITILVAIIIIIVRPWGTQQIVNAVYAATEKAQSYRFNTESKVLDVTTGLIIYSQSVGECVIPDSCRVRVTRETMLENEWRTMDYIVVSEKFYLRYDNNAWSTGPFAETSFQAPVPIDSLTLLKKMRELPEAVVDGVSCIHFEGTLNLEKLTEDSSNIIATIEIWIGKEDSLVRRIELHQEFLKEPQAIFKDGSRIIISETIKFYDYNEPIRILPPQTGSQSASNNRT